MTVDIDKVFDDQTIQALKNNKHEITEELLTTLRAHSKRGKQIALDILDIDMDGDNYYLDAFGNRMSFNGNRRLKKAFSKMFLHPIHELEIKKCAEDINYFKDNYVKIKTQSGVDFPDLRTYQNEYIGVLCNDDFEDVIGLMGRQSGKTVSTGIYLSHLYNFKKDLNMGIVANRGSTAREILNTVKNIIISLPIWMQQGTELWNKGGIENESKMRILTDVPTADAFTGFTMSVLVIDECAKIPGTIWTEFADSIFPSQSGLAWKKNIIISTAYGMNHYYEMVKGARNKTNGMKIYEVDWRDVPRFDSAGNSLSPEDFQRKILEKNGVVYFNQNYANEFVGSSHTLVNSEKLTAMTSSAPEERIDGKLNVYEYPIKGNKYIMTVDAAKDGTDAFAVQVVDVTDFKFRQVAAANLQIDYLLMPEFLSEWCEFYNNPYLIIENNEGAGQSIADQMFKDYEYENLHFDRSNGKRKKYPGFRTTSKTRKQILQTMKLFIENDNLEVKDSKTISEFYRFVLVNNKYQADDGAKDDMVMALAMIFAPFVDTKNFDDMKSVVRNLYDSGDLSEEERVDFSEMLSIASFDDGSDEEEALKEFYNEPRLYDSIEEAIEDMDGFF